MNTRIIDKAFFGNTTVIKLYQGSELVWPLNNITYETVDLGLPSGTLWTTYNIGASAPEEMGDLYAWAELTPKDINTATWANYKWYDASTDSLISPYDASGRIMELNDDIAYVLSSGNLRIPEPNDFLELGDNCNAEWTTINGVQGLKFTSRVTGYTNRWIFFPHTLGYVSPGGQLSSEYWSRYSNIYASLPPNSTDNTHSRSNKLAHLLYGSEDGNNSRTPYDTYTQKCYALGIRPIALQGVPYNRISYTATDSSLNVGSISASIELVGIEVQQNEYTAIFKNAVTTIPSSYLRGRTNLTGITLPPTVQSIGNSAFGNCTSLTRVNMLSGVTSIGENAFSWCTALQSITLPNTVQTIGKEAFLRCTSLSNINIPEGVTMINADVFDYTLNLTSLTLPSTVNYLSSSPFYGSGLKYLTVLNPTPPTIGDFTTLSGISLTAIYVPSGSVNAYKAAEWWSNYSNIIQAIP